MEFGAVAVVLADELAVGAVGVFFLAVVPVRTLRSYIAREIAVSTSLVFLSLLLLFAFWTLIFLIPRQ